VLCQIITVSQTRHLPRTSYSSRHLLTHDIQNKSFQTNFSMYQIYNQHRPIRRFSDSTPNIQPLYTTTMYSLWQWLHNKWRISVPGVWTVKISYSERNSVLQTVTYCTWVTDKKEESIYCKWEWPYPIPNSDSLHYTLNTNETDRPVDIILYILYRVWLTKQAVRK
jgi:hypothetical protein